MIDHLCSREHVIINVLCLPMVESLGPMNMMLHCPFCMSSTTFVSSFYHLLLEFMGKPNCMSPTCLLEAWQSGDHN